MIKIKAKSGLQAWTLCHLTEEMKAAEQSSLDMNAGPAQGSGSAAVAFLRCISKMFHRTRKGQQRADGLSYKSQRKQ